MSCTRFLTGSAVSCTRFLAGSAVSCTRSLYPLGRVFPEEIGENDFVETTQAGEAGHLDRPRTSAALRLTAESAVGLQSLCLIPVWAPVLDLCPAGCLEKGSTCLNPSCLDSHPGDCV